MTMWVDVVTRAWGLGSRLLGRARLEALAGAPDLAAVSALLGDTGYGEPPEAAAADPLGLETHLRRGAGRQLRILARWSGRREALLATVFDDEERRSLRTILRGIAAHLPNEERTRGLLPTPRLPEAALAALARQPDARRAASLLAAWGDPYGHAILREAMRPHPDVFQMLLEIDRAYAARALRASRRLGAPVLGHVRLQIDAENAWTALAVGSGQVERNASELWIPGGAQLSRESFLAIAKATGPDEARARLAARVRGTPLAQVLATGAPGAAAADEDSLLALQLRRLRRALRRDPLAPAAVLGYALRLRAELRDLSRIVWGIAFGVPRPQIALALVSPVARGGA